MKTKGPSPRATQQAIQVSVRLRPLLDKSKKTYMVVLDKKHLKCTKNSEKQEYEVYQFDNVFGPASSQLALYLDCCKPLLQQTLQGGNTTVFAYGPTGTGKTHTILGNPADPGIVLRCIKDLFSQLNRTERKEPAWVHSVHYSYFELYNEVIHDLLQPSNQNLNIRQDVDRHMFITGLTKQHIRSHLHFTSTFAPASEHRKVAATALNEQSSRSHAVLMLTIDRLNRQTKERLIGKMYIIDLAGSENNKKTNNDFERLKESGAINISLLALGQVIDAINNKLVCIPYRASKLTRLLQDSLGGSALCSMIVTLAPETEFYFDNYTSLHLAKKAKNVVNTIRFNSPAEADEHTACWQSFGSIDERKRKSDQRIAEELAEKKCKKSNITTVSSNREHEKFREFLKCDRLLEKQKGEQGMGISHSVFKGSKSATKLKAPEKGNTKGNDTQKTVKSVITANTKKVERKLIKCGKKPVTTTLITKKKREEAEKKRWDNWIECAVTVDIGESVTDLQWSDCDVSVNSYDVINARKICTAKYKQKLDGCVFVPRQASGKSPRSPIGDTLVNVKPLPQLLAQPSGPQPSGPQPSGPQPSGPQPSGPQPSGPQPSGPQPSVPQPSGRQPSGPDTARPQQTQTNKVSSKPPLQENDRRLSPRAPETKTQCDPTRIKSGPWKGSTFYHNAPSGTENEGRIQPNIISPERHIEVPSVITRQLAIALRSPDECLAKPLARVLSDSPTCHVTTNHTEGDPIPSKHVDKNKRRVPARPRGSGTPFKGVKCKVGVPASLSEPDAVFPQEAYPGPFHQLQAADTFCPSSCSVVQRYGSVESFWKKYQPPPRKGSATAPMDFTKKHPRVRPAPPCHRTALPPRPCHRATRPTRRQEKKRRVKRYTPSSGSQLSIYSGSSTAFRPLHSTNPRTLTAAEPPSRNNFRPSFLPAFQAAILIAIGSAIYYFATRESAHSPYYTSTQYSLFM